MIHRAFPGLLIGMFFLSFAALTGCSRETLGPCYNAMTYRNEARKTGDALQKAVLEGKAAAADEECRKQGNDYEKIREDELKRKAGK
jgi:hypothetical protein